MHVSKDNRHHRCASSTICASATCEDGGVASITLSVKCQPTLNLCSLLIYTPPVRHRPRRNRCVFSCKMRLGFILIVNLHVTLANPGEIVVLFNKKCALYQTRQIPCVFSGKTRLVFTVIVNSFDTRPTAPVFRVFFDPQSLCSHQTPTSS